MLTVKINHEIKEKDWLERLFCLAFPRKERCPFLHIWNDPDPNALLMGFYDANQIIGFAYLLTDKDIAHILYFAIDSEKRGCGYGSEALRLIRTHFPNYRIIVDIELESPNAANIEQRIKRRQFYYQNGYADTAIEYDWRGMPYEILCQGGNINKKEFDDFWADFKDENDVK